MKISKNEILEFCNKKHNYKYDYSLVEYKTLRDKVKIICKTHGIFEQRLDSHKISGCPKCNSIKLSNEIFIEKANKIHNNKYDYSLVNYINIITKVKIICQTHGTFELIPDSHLHKKRGCPMCSEKRLNTEIFIEKCKNIHGEKYDYSLVDYKNNHTKIKIICKKHGIFEILSNNHLSKNKDVENVSDYIKQQKNL